MQRLRYLSTIVADVGEMFVFVAPGTCLPLLVALIYAEGEIVEIIENRVELKAGRDVDHERVIPVPDEPNSSGTGISRHL